jgi:dephospho-CoA kinase
MKIIGLTGGIGSGKSTIAKMFEDLGVPVYYADLEAKKLMQTSSIIKKRLVKLVGKEAYIKDKLNTQFIANIVFNNKSKLQELNRIVHPVVNKHFLSWLKKQNVSYVIQENALLFESKNQNNFDFIITVSSPVEVKIERVIKRDNTTKESVLARMKNQLSDAYKIKNSDFIILNTEIEQSKNQVIKLHKKILQKSLN